MNKVLITYKYKPYSGNTTFAMAVATPKGMVMEHTSMAGFDALLKTGLSPIVFDQVDYFSERGRKRISKMVQKAKDAGYKAFSISLEKI